MQPQSFRTEMGSAKFLKVCGVGLLICCSSVDVGAKKKQKFGLIIAIASKGVRQALSRGQSSSSPNWKTKQTSKKKPKKPQNISYLPKAPETIGIKLEALLSKTIVPLSCEHFKTFPLSFSPYLLRLLNWNTFKKPKDIKIYGITTTNCKETNVILGGLPDARMGPKYYELYH